MYKLPFNRIPVFPKLNAFIFLACNSEKNALHYDLLIQIKLIILRTITVNHVHRDCNESTCDSLLSTLELQSEIPQHYKFKLLLVNIPKPSRLDIGMQTHAEKLNSCGDCYLTSLYTDIILLEVESF